MLFSQDYPLRYPFSEYAQPNYLLRQFYAVVERPADALMGETWNVIGKIEFISKTLTALSSIIC
jgi:hypothetical protein